MTCCKYHLGPLYQPLSQPAAPITCRSCRCELSEAELERYLRLHERVEEIQAAALAMASRESERQRDWIYGMASR